jgi:hypothetical protein
MLGTGLNDELPQIRDWKKSKGRLKTQPPFQREGKKGSFSLPPLDIQLLGKNSQLELLFVSPVKQNLTNFFSASLKSFSV